MSSFSFVVLLAFGLLLAAALYTFRYLRVPARLEIVDRLLGSGVGIVFGFVISSITALVLRTLFVTHNLGGQGSLALLRGLQTSARSSSLLPLLVEQIVPQLYTVLSPFLPDAARAFFSLGA